MYELTVQGADGQITRIAFSGKRRLSELLQGVAGAPDYVCGGAGTCGKCRVLASGALCPQPVDGACLACQTFAEGNAAVTLLREGEAARGIETGGEMPVVALRPDGRGYGAAVDIGTTTVVLRLYDLESGEALATASAWNPQKAVAADVMGRIDAALHGQGALLNGQIQACVAALLDEACARAGVGRQLVQTRVVTGNTTMLYLFTGREPASLARMPFVADCLFDLTEAGDYYPPCFGAFVGADIACAVLASGMLRRRDSALLIDLGTNGEMALWHEGRLTCCATAAGPAFEGGNISCGSQAVSGAIESVWVQEGALRCSVIDGGKAQSICGSGLIDAVAALLELEQIDETGAAEAQAIALADGVTLTQKDIRQLQLGKAAIAAGIETLLMRAGAKLGDIRQLYIAGGFGRHLPVKSALRIGMLPEELAPAVRTIGNAALSGASMLLLDGTLKRQVRDSVRCATCLNLGADAYFADSFVEHMMF